MKTFVANGLSRTFGRLDSEYLVRGWFIGAAFSALLIYANHGDLAAVVFGILCAVLMPFSKFVWDELMRLALGNRRFVLWGRLLLLAIFMKVIVNFVLWMFAVLIAPLGMLYIALRK